METPEPVPVIPAAPIPPVEVEPMPVADEGYFKSQIAACEHTLKKCVLDRDNALNAVQQAQGALNLARGQLQMFFPQRPAKPPAQPTSP